MYIQGQQFTGTLSYDRLIRNATFKKRNIEASINIDEDKILLNNGEIIRLENKPGIVNDRIMVLATNTSNI